MKLLDKLNLIAKERQVLPDKIRQHYAMERFLYRLSLSSHADKFCLKGGMLMLGMGSAPARNTLDIDLLGRLSNNPETVANVFREIIHTRPGVQDGVSYSDAVKTEEITKDALYVGVRVSFSANVGGKECPMKIDIGFSDEVYPEPGELSYPPILPEFPAAKIKCYTLESIVAEKWQAMIQLGARNSRMKDFYDLWFLSREYKFQARSLREAIMRTLTRRGTAPELYEHLHDVVFRNALQAEWAAYISKLKAGVYHRKPPVTLPSKNFDEVMDEILAWLSPIMDGADIRTWLHERGWK